MPDAPAGGNTPIATPPPPPPPPAAPPATPPAGEKLYAGKYKTVEELEAGYKGLETKLGKPAEKPADEPKPNAPIAPAPNVDQGIEEFVTSKGLKVEELAAEWQKSGKLTDEQYKALGLPKKMIDQHFDLGSRAAKAAELEAAQQTKAAEAVVGGDAQLKTLRDWASNQMAADPAFNSRMTQLGKQLTDGHLSYPDYIRLVHAEHAQAVGSGKAQPLISGGGAGAPPAEGGFSTSAEMHNAMREAEKRLGKGNWDKDPALMKRIEATNKSIRNKL